MKQLSYGKSINPVVKDNARSRRQKRRRAEEVDNGLVISRIDRALGLKPEKQQYPSRWEKLSKLKPAPPLDLSTLIQYQKQITHSAQKHMQARYPHRGAFVKFKYGSCCLKNVALFQAGYRRCENVTAW
uniref:Probable anti-termination protein n=1 Tax=Phage GMSE-1 TaxID=148339 RepID=Q9B030_9VIRU|nr:probable anti-termination protein [Phage GMSE-1]